MSQGLLLDTNVVSETARPAPDPKVMAFIEENPHCFLSAVTAFELERGIEALPGSKRRRALEEWLALTLSGPYGVLPLGGATARVAARLEVQVRRSGLNMEIRDLFIAATALEHDLTLVTRNVAHFRGAGLVVVDPFVRGS